MSETSNNSNKSVLKKQYIKSFEVTKLHKLIFHQNDTKVK